MNPSALKTARLFAFAVLLAFAARAEAGNYTILDLGTLPGYDSSFGGVINSGGQVAGASSLSDFTESRAIRHDGTTMIDLGTIPAPAGPFPLVSESYDAWAINDNGYVAGNAYYEYGMGGNSSASRAFRHNGATMTDLGTMPAPAGPYPLVFENYFAQAINANNSIFGAGIFGYADGLGNQAATTRVFLHDGTTMIDLGTIATHSNPLPLVSESYEPIRMNDSNQAVGFAYFSYADGLGNSDSVRHPFLYDGTTMLDLNDLLPAASGWGLLAAVDINNAGQITGHGTINGEPHAFLLTPVSGEGAIPEPGTLGLLLSAVFFAPSSSRRRARRWARPMSR